MGIYNDLLSHKNKYYETALKNWDNEDYSKNIIELYKRMNSKETPLKGKVIFFKSDYYISNISCAIILLKSEKEGYFDVTGYDHMRFKPLLILDYEKALIYCKELDEIMEERQLKMKLAHEDFSKKLSKLSNEFSFH